MGFFDNLVKKFRGVKSDVAEGAKNIGQEVREEYDEHLQGKPDPDEVGNQERHQFENEFAKAEDKINEAKDFVADKVDQAGEFIGDKAQDLQDGAEKVAEEAKTKWNDINQ